MDAIITAYHIPVTPAVQPTAPPAAGARPRSFLRARVADARGDVAGASRLFEEARLDLEQQLAESPDDGRLYATLGLTYAKLGLLDEAVAHGERSVELAGPRVDSFTGPDHAYDLARVYALSGDSAAAIEQLEWLLENRSFTSTVRIESDREFDVLRSLPEYRQLIESHL